MVEKCSCPTMDNVVLLLQMMRYKHSLRTTVHVAMHFAQRLLCAVASTLVLTCYTNDSSKEVEAVTTLLEYITELEAIGVTVLVGTELITFVTTLLDSLVAVTVLVVVVMATLVIIVTLDVTLIVFDI